jgi:prepilin-type N-terminal cleavage/methylation domain-containing protein
MKKTAQRGFTLIELLIVIALLGALAVGLLATIDPFEQLKKGRDTAMRNTVSEFYDATLRYYSTKGQFPWATASPATWAAGVPIYSGLTAYVQDLIDTGELKNKFVDLAGTGNLAKIYVTSTAAEHVSVCFKPESKSFQVDPSTIYDQNGNSGAQAIPNCKSVAGASGADCNFCVQ